jgi:transposase
MRGPQLGVPGGGKPAIPGQSNRKKKIHHDKEAYKDRKAIERCFGRLKGHRAIAIRYDMLTRKFLRSALSATGCDLLESEP